MPFFAFALGYLIASVHWLLLVRLGRGSCRFGPALCFLVMYDEIWWGTYISKGGFETSRFVYVAKEVGDALAAAKQECIRVMFSVGGGCHIMSG